MSHDGVDTAAVQTVLCDLDGVVWLAHQPIVGSVDAIARMRAGGRRVVFVTNNAKSTIGEQEATLAGVGIPAEGDVVNSAQAAAGLLRPGERVLVAGGAGIVEAVEAVGAVPLLNDGVVDPGGGDAVDVVVAGLDRAFDYPRLTRAAAALRSGARLIATNEDATYPTPEGEVPGGGALVAAIATAGGVAPVVAGKPHRPMAELIAELLAPEGGFDPRSVVMVGDRPETDGSFAATIGCPFILVRSGVLPPGAPLPVGIEPALDVADLAAVADALGGRSADGVADRRTDEK